MSRIVECRPQQPMTFCAIGRYAEEPCSHATVQYRASTVESEYYCLTEALAAVEHAPRVISNLSIMISTGWEEDTLAAAVSHPPMMATALPSPVAR